MENITIIVNIEGNSGIVSSMRPFERYKYTLYIKNTLTRPFKIYYNNMTWSAAGMYTFNM